MKIKLGSMYGTPQIRMQYWRVEKRHIKIKAYLKVKSPSSERVADKIVKCALRAAGILGIGVIISGGAAVLPAFLAVFLPYLATEGIVLSKDSIRLYTKTSYGRWHRV